MIDLIKHLKDNKYNVCCIFTVSNIDTNDSYFKHCKDLIKKNNIENNFLLISGHHSFPRIITKSDIIIRPTTTDGDALTIREALWFNKSIIASNVVKRPQGTIIFKNRDLADLIEKVVNTINEKTHTSKQNTSNYTSFYLSLYNLNKNDRT